MSLTKWFGAVWMLASSLAAASTINTEYNQTLNRIAGAGGQNAAPLASRQFGRGGVPARAGDAREQLSELLEAHWAWQMRSYPEWATYTGYPGQNDRWNDRSVAALAAQEPLVARTLAVARRITRDALSPADQLNLDLFIYGLENQVDGHAFPDELILVTPMYGVNSSLARALGSMPLFTEPQLADYLARLQGIPAVVEQATATLREGLRRGITPPRVTLAKVPGQVRGLIPAEAAMSPLIKPLDKASAPEDAIDSVRAQALDIFDSSVRPAVEAFADFIENEYIPGAVEATGLSALPEGDAWYAWRARAMTTTDLTPEQIHQIGLAEVKRIREEMFAVMREVGYDKKNIRGFAQYLAQDKSQFHVSAEDMVHGYRALAKRADAASVKLFRRYPSLPYGIQAIPEHEAAGRSGAYYTRGSAENGRPGIFHVNASRLAESPKYEMQALLLHEAVPGHHFQLALAQELKGLPEFRRQGGFTAFIEGWGLYAESLGDMMGFYETPADRFGALTFEMWRAIRLVVDTGMHAMGWSRQQAIDFFAENTGRGMARIEAEVNRYLVMPGQALAYKMGQLKITELRERARAELGDKFDLRSFHDFVLGEGALPLQVLERRVNRWIDKQTDKQ